MTSTEAFFASRAMRALEVLAFGPSSATRLADELQVHPRTARRLLNRMVADGWVIRRDGARPTYAATLRIVALAAQFAWREPLVRHALELNRGLAVAPGEAIHFAVPSYRSALRLVRAGREVVAMRDLAPAHATAAGKLLLAHREPWCEHVLAVALPAVTGRTVTDKLALRAELARVRERGHALEDEELRAGVRALAVPVIGEAGDVAAALALSTRVDDLDALAARAGELAAAAAEISVQAGRR
jgi:DNA-binding IclR family transcriptional regulator